MTEQEAIDKLAVVVDLIPAGNSNRPGTRIDPTHVTIHNTGNSNRGADAAMHARYIRSADARARQVSWHFTVDDHSVYKHLPSNERAWHARAGNGVSIGIEVCENEGIDENAAVERAALLTALMMVAYGIPAEKVVSHQSWTEKDCPRVILRRPGGFAAFRDRAAAFVQEMRGAAAGSAPQGFAPEGVDLVTPQDLAAEPSAALAELADQGAAPEMAMMDAPPAPDTGRVAQLERLVIRLSLENESLRQALESGGGAGDEHREAD
jgi:hypothetical protein